MSVQCLQCLQKFDWESFIYTDRSGDVYTQLRNRPQSTVRQLLDRVRGVEWADETARAELLGRGIELRCPNGHWVPADLRENRTVVIGLIGPPGSSKSHFLAAAIGQMVDGGLGSFNISVHPHSFAENLFFSKYYHPVFTGKKILPKTLPRDVRDADANEPIALEFREVFGRKWNVIFFDSAGEDVVGSAAQAKHALYLAHASAMIFLVEPGSLRGLRGVGAVASGSPARAAGIINNTANTLRTVRNCRDDHSFTEVPTAVAVAKSDLLSGVDGIPDEWLKDPHGRDHSVGPDDLPAIWRRSEAIAPFLERVGDSNLYLTVAQAFPSSTFHLVSATGYAPDAGGTFPEIAPRRCLEPVVAVLAALGILGADARPL